jgi:hypothetical protein
MVYGEVWDASTAVGHPDRKISGGFALVAMSVPNTSQFLNRLPLAKVKRRSTGSKPRVSGQMNAKCKVKNANANR